MRHFGLACSLILITERGRPRINTLLEPAVESLLRFLPAISDVVGGDHGLNVGREPAATGIKIQRFIGKVHDNPGIDEFPEVCPIFEVSGGAIDFMDNDSGGFAAAQQLQHLVKYWAATLGGGLALLKPLDDRQVFLSRMCFN